MAVTSSPVDLKLPVRVTAIAPLTENLVGDKATKPGDVLTIRNGMTIEVLNTDAEGTIDLGRRSLPRSR
jgi:leucyl aminopeptidase